MNEKSNTLLQIFCEFMLNFKGVFFFEGGVVIFKYNRSICLSIVLNNNDQP